MGMHGWGTQTNDVNREHQIKLIVQITIYYHINETEIIQY